jgi:hypothetical protein
MIYLSETERRCIGDYLDSHITAVRTRAAAERIERMVRWNNAVQATSAAWREQFGYKHGPIMDHKMVQREVHAMLATIIDGRLMMLFAPIFALAESIERSLLIVGMLASPSGNGPERYAPNETCLHRISVR